MSPKDFDPNCIFCKIVAGQIPSKIVYKDKDVAVFADANPSAPVHMMVIPVKHITSLATMKEEDTLLAGKLIAAANKVAREKGLADRGYRIVINTGPDAGQVVQHLHMHLLGGREFKWDQ
jgi:histidine triad (HIT) family protein